jgi:thioredoxin-related protein
MKTHKQKSHTAPNATKLDTYSLWISLGILCVLFILGYPLSFLFTFSDVANSPYIYEKKEFANLAQIDDLLSAELDPNAQVIIVEFGDFECQFCKEGQNVVSILESDARIQVVFAHFPSNFHPNAYDASVVYECLRQKGYYEAKQALYSKTVLSKDILNQILADFDTDADCAADVQIQKDIAFGNSLGVRGTPTFMLFKTNDPTNYELVEGANLAQMNFFLSKWLE